MHGEGFVAVYKFLEPLVFVQCVHCAQSGLWVPVTDSLDLVAVGVAP